MTSKLAVIPIALSVLATAFSGTAYAKKVCTNTYNPDGSRCTFCYYTTQPGSGSTVCIKIKAKGGSSNSSPAQSTMNTMTMKR